MEEVQIPTMKITCQLIYKNGKRKQIFLLRLKKLAPIIKGESGNAVVVLHGANYEVDITYQRINSKTIKSLNMRQSVHLQNYKLFDASLIFHRMQM